MAATPLRLIATVSVIPIKRNRLSVSSTKTVSVSKASEIFRCKDAADGFNRKCCRVILLVFRAINTRTIRVR